MKDDLRFQPPSTFRGALPWVSLVAAMFLLTYLDRAMFGPLLPYFEKEFNIDHGASTSFLLSISFGYALSTLFSAYTCSRFLPRTIVSAALVCCGTVLLLMGQTTSLPLIYLLFFALGCSAGHYFNGGLSTMRSLVRPEHWSRAIAVHELGPTLSFVLAPFLAGLGASYFGWRFIVNTMGILSIAGGLIFWRIAQGGTVPAPPVSWQGVSAIWHNSHFWLFTWVLVLGIAGEFAPYSVLSLYMVKELGFSQDLAATLLTISRVFPPIAILYGGFVTSRFGSIQVLMVCFLLFALSMFLMATPWFWPMTIGMFIQPVATAISFPAMFTFLVESFSAKQQPTLLAMSIPMSSILGAGIIPSIMGMFGDHSSFTHGFILLGILALVTTFFTNARFVASSRQNNAESNKT